MKIVVTTPTGNIGSKVVASLVRAGVRPTVIVRDAARLAASIQDRVDVVVGDQYDSNVLKAALAGADSLFWLAPPVYSSPDPLGVVKRATESVISTIRESGVTRTVFLSGFNAGQGSGYGLVDGLTEVEQILEQNLANVTHLRAGFFAENFLFQLEPIKGGQYYGTVDPGRLMPFVTTRDIAEVASGLLLNSGWSGHRVQWVLGPEALTFPEAVARVAKGIGRHIDYVQIPDSALIESFVATGASQQTAELYAEMMRKVSESDYAAPQDAVSTTPSTLTGWAAEVLKPLLG